MYMPVFYVTGLALNSSVGVTRNAENISRRLEICESHLIQVRCASMFSLDTAMLVRSRDQSHQNIDFEQILKRCEHS